MTILRALSQSVKLPQRVPQSRGSGGRTYSMGNLLAGSGQSGMQAYKDVGAAHGPIRRLCQSVSLTDWSLYQQTETSGDVSRELLDDATAPARHPATALWTQPNPYMTRRFFLYIHQLWKITNGGVYWLIVKAEQSPYLRRGVQSDLELWPILKSRIQPVPGTDDYLAGYVYTLGTERIPLPVQAVVPIGWPDPLNPLDFAGPLQSIMPDLESERYAAEYQRNLFLNGARPGGVIEYETPLSNDRFDEIVNRWREQHQGVSNVARVAIIEQGKWVDVAQANTDLQYQELRRLDRETVMYALGMPFAVMQTNDVNLANASMADKQFYRWTLRPELEDIKEPLNERVLPLISDNLTMDYVLPAPEDEAFDVFSSTTGFLTGVLTQNEARAGMGFDAVEDGDRYLFDITGTAPELPKPRLPREPTRLGYGDVHKALSPALADQAMPLADAWTRRLTQVRDQYLALLAQRNGTH